MYDFAIGGFGRQRKAGFCSKQEALIAEKRAREDLLSGARRFTFEEAHKKYLSATDIRDRTRDSFSHMWKQIGPRLGYLYLEEITTSAIDSFKEKLKGKLGPKTINNHLALIRVILRFMWKREHLKGVPYIPMMKVPKKKPDWYSQEERDRFLEGMFNMYPAWYLFFYLTMRLGLRVSEVYAVSLSRIREVPPQLVVDRQVQRGLGKRPAKLIERKNYEGYVLDLTEDVVEAIRWHVQQGYSGEEFLFSKDGEFPRFIDSYKRPMREVQKELKLRRLSHHQLGRHSVASQAVTGGVPIKAVQAQLGHRSEQSTHQYAHLGSRAQLRLVEGLMPSSPPHKKAS